MSGIEIMSSMMVKEMPPSQSYIFFALAIMGFCLSYLFPQFKQNDERTKLIRQKGMYISYFAILIYCLILSFLIESGFLDLSAMQVLDIIVSLMIITVFLSWVVLSKIY
ncbi:permease [Scopulibacillus daqui]|nr:permease [Scopulibacillus daqui]